MANYRKRGDRWQVRVHGLPAQTFTTKREAQSWARDQETAKDQGRFSGGRMTVTEWWEAFQVTSEWRNLRPKSQRAYASVVTHHVLPALGNVHLSDLRRPDIQEWVDKLASQHSPQTACEAHKVLRRLLQVAMKRERIWANPALGITRPKVTKKPHRILTPTEIERVAEAAEDDGLMVRFMAYTGLRFGEVAGLRVKHLNLLHGSLRVHTQIASGTREESEPKSEAAKREVVLPGFLVPMLRKHVEGKGPSDLVFPAPEGGFLHSSNTWDRVWKPALGRAGLGKVTLHDLRHTAISLAQASGASPKEIQALAGHAHYQTTMDVYSHLLPTGAGGRAVAAGMDALRSEAVGQNVDKSASIEVPERVEKAG